MKTLLAAFTVAALALSATSLRADLLGSKVSGTLNFGTSTTNFFNPAFGFVPSTYGNSSGANNVTIGPGVEFGFMDGANRDTANFTATGLTVGDVCLLGTDCAGNAPFIMTFTDPSFATAVLLTNSLGITFNLSGDILTIRDAGTTVPGGNATATFDLGSTAATPEPGTMGLVATGLLGAAGAMRRRLTA